MEGSISTRSKRYELLIRAVVVSISTNKYDPRVLLTSGAMPAYGENWKECRAPVGSSPSLPNPHKCRRVPGNVYAGETDPSAPIIFPPTKAFSIDNCNVPKLFLKTDASTELLSSDAAILN